MKTSTAMVTRIWRWDTLLKEVPEEKLLEALRLFPAPVRVWIAPDTSIYHKDIEDLSILLANSDAQDEISCDDDLGDEALTAEELEQEEALEAQLAELFERALAAAPLDAEESDRLKIQVVELLEAQDITGSILADVECVERLFRVELQHQDNDA